jgi:hypothetical protein
MKGPPPYRLAGLLALTVSHFSVDWRLGLGLVCFFICLIIADTDTKKENE